MLAFREIGEDVLLHGRKTRMAGEEAFVAAFEPLQRFSGRGPHFIDDRLSHRPAPQRYCHATPSASKLLPVRADTPLLAENLIELRGSTGIARVAPMRQF